MKEYDLKAKFKRFFSTLIPKDHSAKKFNFETLFIIFDTSATTK